MLLILVFGMFALTPSEARRLGLLSLLLLGAVMLWRLPVLDPALELAHFLFAGIGVFTVVVASGRLDEMRARLALQKEQLEQALERIRELACRDELTGLLNRREMNTRLQAELARHARNGAPMALVLADIDFFKQINDRLGHGAGDAVLRSFARVAAESLRSTDALARWGGEEFLLLLPGTPADDAAAVIERLRLRLRDTAVLPAQREVRVTFSAGLAVCRPGDDIASLVERADQAMYRAKAAGRDCTVREPVHG